MHGHCSEKYCGVSTKELLAIISIQMKSFVKRAFDSPLELKAKLDEVFRCYMYVWTSDKNDQLYDLCAEVMRRHSNVTVEFLTSDRWKYVENISGTRSLYNLYLT